jgi:hypothetical protein
MSLAEKVKTLPPQLRGVNYEVARFCAPSRGVVAT